MIADFGAAMDVWRTLAGRLIPSGILAGFLVMSACAFVAYIPYWISQYLRLDAGAQVFSGNFEGATQGTLLADVLGLLGGGLLLLVFAARLGLARPMRMVIVDGPTTVNGVGDALRIALSGFGPNLGITLAYAVAVAAGSFCCILPGLALAVLLYPATYLVATERDFRSSFSMSVDWLQKHPGALLGSLGIVVGITLVVSCCSCGFSGAGVSRFGAMSVVYMAPVTWFFGELFGVFTMTLLGSACIAADQADMAAAQRQRSAGPF